jgi:hypothetical protein
MRVLLDECVTRYLKRDFVGHEVTTVTEAKFNGLKNGRLLSAASGQYDVLVTTDQNLRYQQNLELYQLSILVLIAKRNSYAYLKPLLPKALEALTRIKSGEVIEVENV